VLSERLGQFLVEQIGFLERLEGVGVEDRGPDIAVISGRISSARKYVAEIRALIAGFDLGYQAGYR